MQGCYVTATLRDADGERDEGRKKSKDIVRMMKYQGLRVVRKEITNFYAFCNSLSI